MGKRYAIRMVAGMHLNLVSGTGFYNIHFNGMSRTVDKGIVLILRIVY